MSWSLQYGKSPLYIAAVNGDADVVNKLITHSANVDLEDKVRKLYEFIILSGATILDDVHM